MRSRSFIALGALVACGLGSSSAFANGRFPAASQLVFDPEQPAIGAVRVTYGVLVTRDDGKSWDWVCEKAMGYGGSEEDPSIAMTAGSGLLVGTQEGLAVSKDACGWSFPSIGAPVMDLVVRRDDTKGAIALVAAQGKVDDAGNATYQNVLYATTDSGAHWAPYGQPLDPLLIVQTLEVAKSDPHRLYVSGTSIEAGGTFGVILVSKDDGAHFTRHAFPLEEGEVAPFLAAVDPTNADRIYIRVQSRSLGGSRLVVSDDGAVKFRDAFSTTGPMLGFALSQDGSKVFAGSVEDGLFMASSTDLAFAQKSKAPVQCLTTRGATLYACSNEVNGKFVIGASADDGATFSNVLHMGCVRGPVACSDPDASSAVCGADFAAIQQTLGTCPAAEDDAGTGPDPADASTISDSGTAPPGARDAGTTNNGGDGGSSGCATSRAPGSVLTALGAAFAAMLLAMRRRRR